MVVGTRTDDRYILARWMRRMMRERQIRFSELRDMLGVDARTFNRWIVDQSTKGATAVPSDADCARIADLLGVRRDLVQGLAAQSRRAMGGQDVAGA